MWWVRGIFTAYIFIIYLTMLLCGPKSMPGIPIFLIQHCQYGVSEYTIIIFFVIFITSVFFSIIFWKISATEKWRDLMPNFWNLFDPSAYKKIIYNIKHGKQGSWIIFTNPSLLLILLGVLLSVFYLILALSSILLTILIVIWLTNDIYHVIKKKSLADVIKTMFKGKDIKKEILTPLFSNMTYEVLAKQLAGIITIIVTFFIIALTIFLIQQKSPIRIPILLYVPILGYQFYFLYILSKRFNQFLDTWKEYSNEVKSKEIDALPLPTGDIFMFTINSMFIGLLFGPIYRTTRLFFLSLVILSLVNILLLIHYLKSRENKSSRKDLYRDNIRIPIIFSISLASSFFPFVTFKAIILLIILVTLSFYGNDWTRIIDSKYAESQKKRTILFYLEYSLFSLVMFALGQFFGPLAYILGLLMIIFCVLLCVLDIKHEQLEKSK
jgi:hypothetical protein